MKARTQTTERPWFSIVMIGTLVVLLPLLALLQYRWIGQVSDADADRRRQTLEDAGFRSVIEIIDQLDTVRDEFRLVQRYPFVGQNPFESAGFIASFREQLAEDYDDWQATAPNPNLLANIFLYNVRDRQYQRFDPLTSELVGDAPDVAGLERWFDDRNDIPERLLSTSLFADGQLWVVAPVVAGRPGGSRQQFSAPARQTENYMVFEINAQVLWSEIVPQIIETQFSQSGYRVGIQESLTGKLLYASDESVSPGIMNEADFTRDLAPGPQRLFRLIGSELRLGAQHELGSLAEAVAATRRRNLGVGFGILALLGATGAMIIVWSERVRSVGRLQMEFAAGISHELRTPLATIRTAAHNIAAGVVTKPEEIREYAEIVQSEGRRLSAMVDQSIQFAQTEAGRRHYDLIALAVDEVVRQAVETALPAAEESGNRIEIESHGPVPRALADRTALTHCLVNLLTNAIKFGPPEKAIALGVRHDPQAHRILISVHNEGPGIDVDELGNLFEPFFRGRNTSHIPGSGLGLSLVRRMMEGQKGEVSVDTAPGNGATFVLHIPTAGSDPAGDPDEDTR